MCCIPKIPPQKIESTKVALVNKVHVIIFFLIKYMYMGCKNVHNLLLLCFKDKPAYDKRGIQFLGKSGS
jgi:hypothetical protein